MPTLVRQLDNGARAVGGDLLPGHEFRTAFVDGIVPGAPADPGGRATLGVQLARSAPAPVRLYPCHS
jgi:hypothetical protein